MRRLIWVFLLMPASLGSSLAPGLTHPWGEDADTEMASVSHADPLM